MNARGYRRRFQVLLIIGWVSFCAVGWAASIDITDDAGHRIRLDAAPCRVVSVVPSATEIIFAIDAGKVLAGITHHSSGIRGAADKAIVGGFLSPSVDRILALNPDLVIVSSIHSDLIDRLAAAAPVLVMNTREMNDAFRHIQWMGALLHREAAAAQLVGKNRRQLDLVARKVAGISEKKRKRVMRIMGTDRIMTPGSDSFQNQMIRAAGGIPPDFNRKGGAVPVTREEFFGFNPQVLYGCGGDRKTADSFFLQDDWKRVDALREHRFYSFPCDLTCRAASHVGAFVAWLSSRIYSEEFSDAGHDIVPGEVVSTRDLLIPLDFVRAAVIADSTVHDCENKSLIVDFKTARTVVSTLEGQRDDILTVGNHYASPPCWSLNHYADIKSIRNTILPVIGKDEDNASFLYTGADMDNLAVIKETFREMTVYALVTAGVRGNAMRMSRDAGLYYEPGTINMIFLTNMKLSPRAMTRAIISATEGKTAALQDLDIRSSYLPVTAAATGTGTDNIIVVQGDGPPIDNAGGHSKMGELIARTAYTGVREAIARQNGIVGKRNLFQRFKDRQMCVFQLVSEAHCDVPGEKGVFSGRVEQVLMDPAYAGFLEAAMALSDGAGRKTVNDFVLFETWCLDVASRIAGSDVETLTDCFSGDDLPIPLAMSLNAVFSGVSLNSAFSKSADDETLSR